MPTVSTRSRSVQWKLTRRNNMKKPKWLDPKSTEFDNTTREDMLVFSDSEGFVLNSDDKSTKTKIVAAIERKWLKKYRIIPVPTKSKGAMTARTYCSAKGLSTGWFGKFKKLGRKSWVEWDKLYAKMGGK